jgi:hypothetical protein
MLPQPSLADDTVGSNEPTKAASRDPALLVSIGDNEQDPSAYVPNHVPDTADLTRQNQTEPDEKRLYKAKSRPPERHHNPRVGGSSPSSGIAAGGRFPRLCRRSCGIRRGPPAEALAPWRTIGTVPMAGPGTTPEFTVVPANEASWEDLLTIFGTRGQAFRCPRYKLRPR